MKILLLDIENTPNLAWIWQARNDYISYKMLERNREIMCFAAKWYGEDFTYWYQGEDIVPKAHAMMSEADAIITFNGKRHDIPILNQEFARMRLTPPAPSKQIDLCQVVKSNFNLFSNSLAYTLDYFGLPGKADSGGMDTWLDCMNPASENFESAWDHMEYYNREDVVIMEPLYELLLPWISGHPNHNLYGDEEWVCPSCGSLDLAKEGFRYTSVSKTQRYSCRACGAWSSDGKRIEGSAIR